MRSGWQLVFVDREEDVLLVGDDPWQYVLLAVLVIPSEQFRVAFSLPYIGVHCNLQGIREYGILHKNTLPAGGAADGQAGA